MLECILRNGNYKDISICLSTYLSSVPFLPIRSARELSETVSKVYIFLMTNREDTEGGEIKAKG